MTTITADAICPVLVRIPSRDIERGCYNTAEALRYVACQPDTCEVYRRCSASEYEHVLTWHGRHD